MKKLKYTIAACCAALTFGLSAQQQITTLYFLENAPMRHYINPAFQPVEKFYLGLPGLGYMGLWMGNNSLSLSDLVYKTPDGQTVWALNPEYGDRDKLFNRLRNTTMIDGDIRVNLLQFGWKWGESYWHVFVDERINMRGGLPKDLFKLPLYGMEDIDGQNRFDLRSTQLELTGYTEVGIGYARHINEHWHIGAKLKGLFGTAYASTVQKEMMLTMSPEQWAVRGSGTINMAAPAGIIEYPENLSNLAEISINSPSISSVNDIMSLLKPAGMGGAVDLGVEYTPFDMLSVSASVVDLGLIRWKGRQYGYDIDATYEGVALDFDQMQDGALADTITARLTQILENAVVGKDVKNSFLRMTSPKLNIAVEGRFWENRVGVGIVSTTGFINSRAYEEVTAGVSFRPSHWFNLAGSYSFINGRWSSVGAGISIGATVFNLTLAADYVPTSYAKYNGMAFVPYKAQGLNLAFGLNIVVNNPKNKDKDKDGVRNKLDKCPDTPLLVSVDKNGCPIDSDGDGVPDYLDQCPNTLAEGYATVDEFGCPADADNDGVPDYLDKCPDTPVEAVGYIDNNGCPVDTDLDGVPDYLDQCPGTPRQAYGFVDEKGCLKDTDGDGVPDYIDRCNDTPAEAYDHIDQYGCPIDTDNDGVPDYLDHCPGTPAEAKGLVDEKGCPKDTDGDEVPDYLDHCPRVPGSPYNNGCPEVKKEVKSLFKKALQGIQFETGKAIIKPASYGILRDIATVLKDNPTYQVEIQGHTDNVGNPASNQALSQKRADAVRAFLVKEGVPQARMVANGYGDTKPVADNKTAKGRAQNRRVEFIVSFEETSYQLTDNEGNIIPQPATLPADSIR